MNSLMYNRKQHAVAKQVKNIFTFSNVLSAAAACGSGMRLRHAAAAAACGRRMNQAIVSYIDPFSLT